jgi:two-component system chemotaxis response regulator CheY
MPALVLIAESDPNSLRLLREICEAAGHTVLTAMERASVLDAVSRRRPDIVLVDVALEGAERGLELLRALKAEPSSSSIPVLVTAPAADVDAGRRGIELGADDCVSRPYRVFEIHQRVRNTLRRAWLERLSTGEEGLDPLSRAGSPMQLPITLDYEMTRALRFDHPLACVSLEVANFEALVDAVGPARVELLLGELAASVRQCIRGIDHLFRASDRELVLVLPETAAAEASVVIGRVRDRARDGTLCGNAGRVTPSLTFGVAGRVEDTTASADALLRAARGKHQPIG